MRLATARDEIVPLRDPRVRDNEAYLTVLLLSRVVTRLGTVTAGDPGRRSRGCSRRTWPSSRTSTGGSTRRATPTPGHLPVVRHGVRGRRGRWCPGGIVTYAADQLLEEVAYVACRFHWSLDDVLDLEHPDRDRFVRAVERFTERTDRWACSTAGVTARPRHRGRPRHRRRGPRRSRLPGGGRSDRWPPRSGACPRSPSRSPSPAAWAAGGRPTRSCARWPTGSTRLRPSEGSGAWPGPSIRHPDGRPGRSHPHQPAPRTRLPSRPFTPSVARSAEPLVADDPASRSPAPTRPAPGRATVPARRWRRRGRRCDAGRRRRPAPQRPTERPITLPVLRAVPDHPHRTTRPVLSAARRHRRSIRAPRDRASARSECGESDAVASIRATRKRRR